MRIGIASDLHLGFGRGKRKNDARIQAERALRKLIAEGADMIILAGDIFNTPVPRPEVFRDAAQVLQIPRKKKSDLRLTGIGRDSPDKDGIPVLAIHGNHERRVRGDVNPVKLMDIMGFLTYLQQSGVVAENVSVYGIGAVPESYAPKIFKDLKAEPFSKKSFFVFHQDLVPYIPRAKLTTQDLPRGFSYYVNGHVHNGKLEKNMLIVGSTIVTQMRVEESKKFVWIWDEKEGFTKSEIESRSLYHIDVDADERAPSEILKEIDDAIQKLLKNENKEEPMIRIKVKGKLSEGFKSADLIFRNDYGAILSYEKRIEGSVLQNVDLSDIDIDNLAVKALNKVLTERGLRVNSAELYAHLMRGDEIAVWKLLEGMK